MPNRTRLAPYLFTWWSVSSGALVLGQAPSSYARWLGRPTSRHFWATQLKRHFNGRTTQLRGTLLRPRFFDEPTSGCQILPSVWSFSRGKPVIPGFNASGVSGSDSTLRIWPRKAFVPARPVQISWVGFPAPMRTPARGFRPR